VASTKERSHDSLLAHQATKREFAFRALLQIIVSPLLQSASERCENHVLPCRYEELASRPPRNGTQFRFERKPQSHFHFSRCKRRPEPRGWSCATITGSQLADRPVSLCNIWAAQNRDAHLNTVLVACSTCQLSTNLSMGPEEW